MAGRSIFALLLSALLVSVGAASSSATGTHQGQSSDRPEQWRTARLSEARVIGAQAQVGSKVIFAGGCSSWCYHPRASSRSSAVDSYDSTTGQ